MKDVKVKPGYFMEYSDDEESYVVLVTSVDKQIFHGITVQSIAKTISEDDSFMQVGEHSLENGSILHFHTDDFKRVKNPYKVNID